MAYASLTDLEDVIPQTELVKLLNDTGSTYDQPTQTRATAFLDAATSDIDMILGGQATTLLDTTQLRKLTLDIAAFRIVSRRATKSDEGPITVRKLAHDNAIRFLQGLAKEHGLSGGLATAGIAAGVAADSRTKQFTDDNLERF